MGIMKSGVFFVLLVCVIAQNPGVKFYVDYRALGKLEKQILIPLLAGLDSVSLPDFQVETSLELSPSTVSVTNVKLGEVIVYRAGGAALVPPSRIDFELLIASAIISFDWEASCCTDTRGNGKITLKNSHVYTNFTLGETKGQLTIVPEIEIVVGDLKASYEVSELGWLYEAILNLHGEQLKGDVKGIVQDRVKKLLREKIAELVGSAVYTLVEPSVIADFSLLHSPIVHSTYVEFAIKGEVYDSAAKQKPKFAPTPLPYEWLNPDQMAVSADISLATILSLLDATSSSGMLKLSLFPFMLDDDSSSMTTSYWEYYLPGLTAKHGDRDIYLVCELHTTKTKGVLRDTHWGEFIFPATANCEMRFKGEKDPFGTVSATIYFYMQFVCDRSSIFMKVERCDGSYPMLASVPSLGLKNVHFELLDFLIGSSEMVRLPVKGLRLPNIGVNFCDGGLNQDHTSFYGLLATP